MPEANDREASYARRISSVKEMNSQFGNKSAHRRS